MELDAITAELPAEPESAHTISRESARKPRIELITRGERRRRCTIEQKQTIAAQSLGLGASQTEWRVNMASAAGKCRLRPTVAFGSRKA